MKKIVIIGHKGVIGSIIVKGLKRKYRITGLDLPQDDLLNFENLIKKSKNAQVVIHLALKCGDFQRRRICADDFVMAYNVFESALMNNVSRVIVASSIHADSYPLKNFKKNSVDRVPVPDGTYGAMKVYVESLGRFYAKKGLEVVCIRFGGVNKKNNKNLKEEYYDKIFLDHKDLLNLIEKAIEAPLSQKFELLNAVSDNPGRFHDVSNNLGWNPSNDRLIGHKRR